MTIWKGRPPKLTREQHEWLFNIAEQRRSIPTNAELASMLGVHQSTVDEATRGVWPKRYRAKVP